MKKAYILDLDLLNEQNITPEEFVNLISIYNNDGNINKSSIINLQEKNYIKILKDEIVVREKGKLLLEFLSIEGIGSINNKKTIKRSSRSIDNDLKDFVEKYRLLWKGLKPGSMGSTEACRDKLQRWMSVNTQYTTEDIYRAAKSYINSVDNYQYLQQADFFIYKKDAFGEQSRLSSFIDEVENAEEDWTKILK